MFFVIRQNGTQVIFYYTDLCIQSILKLSKNTEATV